MSPSVNDNTTAADISGLIAVASLGSILAFVLSMVNSFKRVISPALVLLFCAAEGVALGAISKVFEMQFPGVVMSAVLGTFGAFAGTLAVYKFFNIKVTDKFRRMVVAAMLGVVAISLIEFVLSLFGAEIGLFGDGWRRPAVRASSVLRSVCSCWCSTSTSSSRASATASRTARAGVPPSR